MIRSDMVILLPAMSSCGVGMEAPSLVHTGLTAFLFPEGCRNFLWKIWNIRAARLVLLDKWKRAWTKSGSFAPEASRKSRLTVCRDLIGMLASEHGAVSVRGNCS